MENKEEPKMEYVREGECWTLRDINKIEKELFYPKIRMFNQINLAVRYIKSNLNGGLPAGCNSTEARLNR